MKEPFFFLLLFLLPKVGTMAQTCPPGPPVSPHDGTTEGVALAGDGRQFNFKYAQIAGFDCFEQLRTWFPTHLRSSHSISPNHTVLDMAYAIHGTATFHNVTVPSKGNYTLRIRYAYAFGFFPRVTDRPEGIAVNGQVITYDMHFPITYSFDDYDYSSILVPLNAGKNTIQVFNVTNHGVARIDTMVVAPSGSSLCSDAATVPGWLSAMAVSSRRINLKWAASTWPSDCAEHYYNVFRGTSRNFIPSSSNQIAKELTTRFYSDVTLSCATTYYYFVEAVDTAGASASAQVSARTAACGVTSAEPVSP
jgi:hypothetical protein